MHKVVQLSDPEKRAMLLTALYIAQEQHGYLSPEAIEQTADRLGLPTQEVYSTASFYTMFRTKPVGRYVLQVCTGLCCFLADGGERLVDYLEQTHRPEKTCVCHGSPSLAPRRWRGAATPKLAVTAFLQG